MIAEGSSAPAFTSTDQNGMKRSLADYAGSWLILYFYPKDDTPGCTTEACSFRDNLSTLGDHGIQVIGVSTDNEESHRSFTDKYALNFPLLPDTDKKIVRAYGASREKSLYGKLVQGTHRMSFLIDPQGKIARVYEKVTPDQHVEEVLHDVQKISS